MPEIKDTGKVWIRGQVGTVFAIKVDGRIFVPGLEGFDSIEYWLGNDNLYVDLHDPKSRIRLARLFPLDLNPKHPAALFSGFTKTKHAEFNVISFEDEGVITEGVQGREYEENGVEALDSRAFWDLLGWDF